MGLPGSRIATDGFKKSNASSRETLHCSADKLELLFPKDRMDIMPYWGHVWYYIVYLTSFLI